MFAKRGDCLKRTRRGQDDLQRPSCQYCNCNGYFLQAVQECLHAVRTWDAFVTYYALCQRCMHSAHKFN